MRKQDATKPVAFIQGSHIPIVYLIDLIAKTSSVN